MGSRRFDYLPLQDLEASGGILARLAHRGRYQAGYQACCKGTCRLQRLISTREALPDRYTVGTRAASVAEADIRREPSTTQQQGVLNATGDSFASATQSRRTCATNCAGARMLSPGSPGRVGCRYPPAPPRPSRGRVVRPAGVLARVPAGLET